jgi:saccharopine dehydrogenase-like NADP-dependent oxidoreductase
LNKRVLVLGGYGVFGGLLARGLIRQGFEVLVAGRDLAAAQAHCTAWGGVPIRFDRDKDDIAHFAPWAVVDAAGPFQAYGNDPYRLARAALQSGAHYLDLSDDGMFSAGIAELDTMACNLGLVALSGVSSVPALSSVAAAHLAQDMSDIHLIESAILPGNRAPRGLSVIRAILAQVGRPVHQWRGDKACSARGWTDARQYDLPGLGKRRASIIGAPDTMLFPRHFNARSVTFRAGLELGLMHRGLALLGLLTRLGIMKTLVPLARPLRWLADLLAAFGTDRGGMVVQVTGLLPDGSAEERIWSLTAGAGDGPHIPSLPALILTERLDDLPKGAGPALAAFTLTDFARVAQGLDIKTQTTSQPFQTIFPAVLGRDFARLPPALQDLHHVIDCRHWQGRARIARGSGRLARLVAWAMGFPPALADAPVSVRMERHGQTETWTRDFAGHRFRSHLRPESDGGLTERFGPLRFRIGLRVVGDTLDYPVTRGWAFGLPLPRLLLPVSITREALDTDGRPSFDVALSHPWIGLIIRYQGWLAPAPF